ncbi:MULTISPECIES: trimeric intracellular cation channel family protein [Phenylobacterium]|uniref:Membrane protein YeiH n=1 Tax=Phenylobacterium koreense TaxID=266125 RepID=A0ABV2EHA1_9CAUL
MDALATAFVWLDYAAVAVFGATGALAAAQRKHDIVTFCFFAAVTGVGGGTMRDLFIDAPVFWVQRPDYIIACIMAAIAVWVFGAGDARMKVLLWLDALGMAAYSVVGAAKAISLGVMPFSAVVMGVLTACFGGIIRDVLAGEPSILLRREIYVTCALIGAGVYVVLYMLGVRDMWSGLGGFAAAFVVRAGAIARGWMLPAFPGRGRGRTN